VIDSLPYGPVPWQEVVGMYTGTEPKSGRPFLRLLVRHPNLYRPRDWLSRLWVGPIPMRDVGELRIPIGMFDKHYATLSAAAIELRSRVQPPMLQVWMPGMSAQQVDLQQQREEAMRRLGEISERDPELRFAKERDEVQRLAGVFEGPDPVLPHFQAQARRIRRLMWVTIVVGVLALALQAYRFAQL